MLSGLGFASVISETTCFIDCPANFALQSQSQTVGRQCTDYDSKVKYLSNIAKNAFVWTLTLTVESYDRFNLEALNAITRSAPATFPVPDNGTVTDTAGTYDVTSFNLNTIKYFEFMGQVYQDGDPFYHIYIPKMSISSDISWQLVQPGVQLGFTLDAIDGQSLPFYLWEIN